MIRRTLRPRPGQDWKKEATRALRWLDRKPCSGKHEQGCFKERQLDLVTRRFRFNGKGRKAIIDVTVQRCTMIALLKAMRDKASIQVAGLGSYRSCELQAALYKAYLRGDGHLVAAPGRSGHNIGVCLDLYKPTAKEREAMLSQGFHDLLPQDPPHFNLLGRY